jgi:O-methyltransferase
MKRLIREHAEELLDLLAGSRALEIFRPLVLLQGRGARLSLYSEQTRVLSLAFKYTSSEDVPGDYAEFGVWKGRTFIEAWRVAAKYGVSRRFVAFDSFEGLPELSERDRGGPFAHGQFKHSRELFEARLRRARVPQADVTIVQGRFDQTLAHPEEIPLERVAVAWIDCDLYESTVPVLQYLTPRLSPGSVLLFDDWYTFRASPEKGEMLACREWLQEHPTIELAQWYPFHFAGQAFIVQSL